MTADPVPEPEKPLRAPLLIPRQLGLAAAGAAVLGGGALVWTQIDGGFTSLDDNQKDVARIAGVSALAASGAILAASLALTVFDPSTGTMRFSIEEGG